MKRQLVSVIIPAYNSGRTIEKTLNSLIKQRKSKYNVKLEICVVNDGSTDDTAKIVVKYIKKYRNIKLINQVNQGPAAARNNGAKKSRGDIILFTDADCEPINNWIDNMITPFIMYKEVQGVKGAYRTKQKNLVAQFVQYEYEYKYKKMLNFNEIDFIDTYSAGYRKDIFLKYNGYNTNFPVACAEDVELSFRMKKDNVKMVFNPNAIVYHIHPTTVKNYFLKKMKFAYWRMAAVSLHPDFAVKDSHTPQTMKIQIVSLFLIGLFVLLRLFSQCASFFKVAILIFSTVYIISILPFYTFLIKKNFKLSFMGIPLIIVRNIAQGIGIIKRIIDNVFKRNIVIEKAI